jgi:hypothetical protein
MARARSSSAGATVAKGEGPDRAPSEVFNGPAHELNLGVGQTTFINDLKKRELEEAFGDRYHFTLIEHHGTLNPIEGDHEIAWEVRRMEDAVDEQPELQGEEPVDEGQGAIRPDGLPGASDDQMLNPETEEGVKDGQSGVTDQPDKSDAPKSRASSSKSGSKK